MNKQNERRDAEQGSEQQSALGIDDLRSLDVGVELTLSVRKTPVTVTDVSEHDQWEEVTVTAENHHGEYVLTSYGDGSVVVRAGEKNQLVDGDATVYRYTSSTESTTGER